MEFWQCPMENMAINADFWKGKRALLTGHTGFKGSWLTFWLSTLGAEVVGYSLSELPSQPNHFALLNLPIPSISGDVRDVCRLTACLNAHQPDIVFHLAAQAFVRRSYAEPLETFDTNVIGTASLLEACRKTESVKAIVVITSDKCYDNQEWVWGYRENDSLGGYDPYSASKGCAEIVAASYRNAFFPLERYGASHQTLLATCRAGNVIGGGDWGADRLIPDMVRATAVHEIIQIRNPDAIRPWQHVLEPLSGYLLLGQGLLEGNAEFAEAWNFGPFDHDELSVLEIIEMAQREWNDIRYEIATDSKQPYEAARLTLDCSKARRLLGWKPRWNIATALAKTLRWYRSFYEQGVIMTMQDLQDYVSEIRVS